MTKLQRILVGAVLGFCVGMLIQAFLETPRVTAASAPARFGVSDGTALADGLGAWVVHDRKHPDQCALVVHLGSSLTSQPWRCE